MRPMELKWQDLVCGYAGAEALHVKFSGDLREPGIYAVVGPNGCGKSTLLKTWLGLVSPLSGQVMINGIKVEPRHRLPPGVSYVPQTHHVNRYFHISVSDFVKQGCLHIDDTEARDAKVNELLKKWDLIHSASKSFHELSVGQKTRALVARAFALSPSLVFLDEPLASLDVHCQHFLMNALSDLVAEGMKVVMVEHHLRPFKDHLKACIVFDRGHVGADCHVESRVCNVRVSGVEVI